MKKFVIASHGETAAGLQSTLELFVGKDYDIRYFCAYTNRYPDIDQEIDTLCSEITSDDQVIIFTDLYGGSVNQKMALKLGERDNVFIIAGFNIPLIIELILSPEHFTFENIQKMIASSREAMRLSNFDENLLSVEHKTEIKVENNPIAGSDSAIDDWNDTIPTTIRVDERLIHGQIAMVWSRELKLHGILVANDDAAVNETQQMALKMAVPSGIKVLIRSVDEVSEILKDPRSRTRRLLVLVRTIEDARRIVRKMPDIEMVNIGNVGKSVEGQKTTLSQFVMLTDEEMQSLKSLLELYPNAALQNLPSDKKILAKDLIKGGE